MKVKYYSHMGSDDMVVDMARASFAKQAKNYDQMKNEKLIGFLARENHWAPFGHPQIILYTEAPIFVARQDFKHQIGFVRSEQSRRYVDSTPEFYTPDTWRKKADNVKQGSSEGAVEEPLRFRMTTSETTSDVYKRYLEISMDLYKELLENDTCAEQARMVLPQSMMTSYYVTGSLAAWARAYKLRIDSHSQKEIQMLAKQWDEIIRPLFPVSWEALVDG